MRISEQVYLVGSGRLGMGVSHDFDCNVYLLDGGDECALVDAGAGIEPERIVTCIERDGISMRRVRRLLLTHLHADHAAGAAFWSTRYGVEVVCAREGASWLESADMEKTSLGAGKAAGVYPADFNFPPCRVDATVSEGDTLHVGPIALQVMETPGHARGHVSYLMDGANGKSLFAGDVVFGGGKIVCQNTWDCSIPEYARTLARLHALRIERLFPGHGAFLLSQAHMDIARAHEIFAGLRIPPNFV